MDRILISVLACLGDCPLAPYAWPPRGSFAFYARLHECLLGVMALRLGSLMENERKCAFRSTACIPRCSCRGSGIAPSHKVAEADCWRRNDYW